MLKFASITYSPRSVPLFSFEKGHFGRGSAVRKPLDLKRVLWTCGRVDRVKTGGRKKKFASAWDYKKCGPNLGRSPF